MKLFHLRVRGKLLLPIVGVVFLGLASLVAFSSYRATNALKTEINAGILIQAQDAAKILDGWIGDLQDNVSYWSRNPVYVRTLAGDEASQDEAMNRLKDILKEYDYFEAVDVAAPNGLVIVAGTDSHQNINVADRDYFTKAMAGELNMSKAIVSKASGEPIVVLAAPVHGVDGSVAGVLFAVVKLAYLSSDIIGKIKVGETGYGLLTDETGLVLAHQNHDFIMQLNLSQYDFGKEMVSKKSGIISYWFDKQQVWKTMGVAESNETGWLVAVTATMDELTAPLVEMRNWSIFVGAITLVLVALLILLVVARISRVLKWAATHLTSLAEGDVSREIPDRYLNMQDEFGDLAKGFETLTRSQRDKADLAEAIAAGDLSREVHPASGIDRLGLALKSMNDTLNDTITLIQESAEQVASGSSQVSDSSQGLSQGATEQAASLEEITSSMTEIGSQTRNNAEYANQASSLAREARDAADQGSEAMGRMVGAMSEINESSQAIAKIIKVIDEIAFQTNLLALNAAVEAARAGHHGKGFAVVAEEVRNLAGRSAKAAQETAELIEGSTARVRNGSDIANQTAEALQSIVESSTKSADIVAEIAAASGEQAEGIAQVSEGLGQIDQVTQQNTANAEETASAAEELSSQSGELRRAVSRFRLRNSRRPVAAIEAPAEEQGPAPSRRAAAGEWGDVYAGGSSKAGEQVRSEDIIALDDKEFERY